MKHLKLVAAITVAVGLAVSTGCSTLTIETPNGYKLTRRSFLAWYDLNGLSIQTSNACVSVGHVTSGSDTNGMDKAGDIVEKAVSAAVKAGIKGAAI